MYIIRETGKQIKVNLYHGPPRLWKGKKQTWKYTPNILLSEIVKLQTHQHDLRYTHVCMHISVLENTHQMVMHGYSQGVGCGEVREISSLSYNFVSGGFE